MKRTTIMFPHDLKARAERAARERGISFGELVRRSLRSALEATPNRSDYSDPLYADNVVYTGDTPADLASAHDGYL
jgi:ribonuclease BN (tRNA processing enzyme)